MASAVLLCQVFFSLLPCEALQLGQHEVTDEELSVEAADDFKHHELWMPHKTPTFEYSGNSADGQLQRQDTCNDWCDTNGATWEEKCKWGIKTCSTCGKCEELEMQKPCPNWCEPHSHSWDIKCAWVTKDCLTCDPCGGRGSSGTTSLAIHTAQDESGESDADNGDLDLAPDAFISLSEDAKEEEDKVEDVEEDGYAGEQKQQRRSAEQQRRSPGERKQWRRKRRMTAVGLESSASRQNVEEDQLRGQASLLGKSSVYGVKLLQLESSLPASAVAAQADLYMQSSVKEPSVLSLMQTRSSVETSVEATREYGNVSAFIAVHSKQDFAARRYTFRRAWKRAALRAPNFLMKFAVCNASDQAAPWLEEEQLAYGDLLLLSCQDESANAIIAEKQVALMKAYHEQYSDKALMLQVEDNTFVAWTRLLKKLVKQDIDNRLEMSYFGVNDDDQQNKTEPSIPDNVQGSAHGLGSEVVKQILDHGIAMVVKDQQAVGTWIDDLTARGVKVNLTVLPGKANANEPYNFCQRKWKDYPYIVHPGIIGQDMDCLSWLDEKADPDQRADVCLSKCSLER